MWIHEINAHRHISSRPFLLKFRAQSSCFLMVKQMFSDDGALLQLLHAHWKKYLLLQILLLHSSYTI